LLNDKLSLLLNDEKFFLRRYTIPKTLEGYPATVHRGEEIKMFKILRGNIKHKFGEFAITKVLGADFRF
jgi:ribosomal protein S19